MKYQTIRNALLTALVVSLLLATSSAMANPAREGEVRNTAAVSGQISYQGQLTDASGNPLSGSHNFKFELYDAAWGGTKLWEQTKTGVGVQNGLFTVQLDIDPSDFDGQALWLAISVNGQLLSPRQELLPVPYALSLRPGAYIWGGIAHQAALDVYNADSDGVIGWTGIGVGVVGGTDSSRYGSAGVLGIAESDTGHVYGVRGESHSTEGGVAVVGHNYGDRWAGYFETGDWTSVAIGNNSQEEASLEVWNNADGPAAAFWGDVHVYGNLTKSGGGFKIDHPLDPENRYLSHSFVESPDRMNIYTGNVILDANGEALVELPDYFQALNQDFTYQLTAIGAPAPNLHVAEEISGNRFKIAGGPGGVKVSWQVTGIRHDAWARANPVAVEEEKSPAEDSLHLLYPTMDRRPSDIAGEISRNPKAQPRPGGEQ